MAERASSSSSSFTGNWVYDVFLSFRGEDTRHSFTGHLYNSLCQKGIHTFIDDEELPRGEEITPTLLNAIQNSRIAIIVFSKNYASSTFCLNELVKILECFKGEDGRSVFPIFYDVDPSDVRHQIGTYSEALAKHEERFQDDKDKVKKWRKALYEAADLSGWHFQHGSQTEYKFIREIVDAVSEKINHIPLHVAENPIGLDYSVQIVKSLIEHGSDVNMIGIYGVGGIGKTTIARAVYNSIFSDFQGMCFLPDIREKAINNHGLAQLQEMLLSEILKEKDVKVGDVNRGIPMIKGRLQHKKVLLVLDDIDKLEQLKALAEYNWFGSGSIILITTRDKHLLATHGVVKLYEVKPLNDKKALELFNWHAFKNKKAPSSYVNISNRAVSYAHGLPLALQVIGSHLFGKSLNECNSALDKYKRTPHKKIHEILKVSYDGLEENEKGIFLDIACFFNSQKVGYITQMLQTHGFDAEDGLRVLIDRSLIKVSDYGLVRMHDLVRDMGIEVVRQESTLEPGRRSRLLFKDDIVHVLEENTGTDNIEFIKLEGYNNTQVQWNGKAFMQMKNLRILIVKNTIFSIGPEYLPNSLRVLEWSCYPSPSLPSDFNLKRVEILSLPESCLQIFQPRKILESLSTINFKECKFLTKLPSLRDVPLLTDLCLNDCTNLVNIDGSIGFLEKLRYLNAKRCTKLKILAPCIMLPSLEILDLSGCLCLESFPEALGKMEETRKIYLNETAIDRLPFSIGNFIRLELLSLQQCPRLYQLPGSISILPKVEVIIGYWFRMFEENQDEEVLTSEVLPRSILICNNYYKKRDITYTYLDVYYTYISPNNAIQVCSPDPLLHSDFLTLFQNLARGIENAYFYPKCWKSSMCFSFRNKFPKIAVCCSILPTKRSSYFKQVFVLKLRVYINGSEQFSSSCNYIFHTWNGGNPILWCDLQSKEETFSEYKWNQAEILFELKYPQRCRKEWSELIDMGYVQCTLIGVYKEGNNKKDIEFKDPMSPFSFPSSLYPFQKKKSCLYYVASQGERNISKSELFEISLKELFIRILIGYTFIQIAFVFILVIIGRFFRYIIWS